MCVSEYSPVGVCLAWACVCARVTRAGLCLGAGRGAARVGGGSALFLLSVSTFQSQPDCFPSAGWAAWPARPVGLPRFSSFQPPWVWRGWSKLPWATSDLGGGGRWGGGRRGASSSPRLGPAPHRSPPGECNKALTFLRGCQRDLIKEEGESWLALRRGWG